MGKLCLFLVKQNKTKNNQRKTSPTILRGEPCSVSTVTGRTTLGSRVVKTTLLRDGIAEVGPSCNDLDK